LACFAGPWEARVGGAKVARAKVSVNLLSDDLNLLKLLKKNSFN